MQISPKSKLTITLISAYLTSFALSFVFWPLSKELISPTGTASTAQGVSSVDPGEPRTESCPLNGRLYTKTERSLWEQRRPMAVMIENHKDARPQLGLSKADIVYETIAEGGITRFMAVYYCDAAFGNTMLGPVRSARTYFLDWASEYSQNPIYVHVGGANTPGKANALGQIEDYGWAGENDLNQFGLPLSVCMRDDSYLGNGVASEHTMYCGSKSLWDYAANKRGWASVGKDGEPWQASFRSWKFTDQVPDDTNQPAANITFDFWDGFTQYKVGWSYLPSSKTYKRTNGGKDHLDYLTQKPLEATTVVVQFVKETGPIDSVKHMLYGTKGSGKAIVFTQGKAEKLIWKKKTRLSRTIFYTLSGKEYQFQPGKIWIEAVPLGNKITY